MFAAAAVAALTGAVAPFARDASLIGHPTALGSFADSAGLYRTLLAASFGLGGAAMAGVVVLNIQQIRSAERWRRPAAWAAVAVATVWAAGAFGSALDYAAGDGGWASGACAAAVASAVAAVPVVVAFGLVSSRWDRPELAGLVIDLETDGAELGPAVAKALEDPSIEVFTSLDGETLFDDSGTEVNIDDLPTGRVLAQIRSSGQLVGGLVHDAAIQQHPERLQAVAAAAGLALDVARLNDKVTAQLEEVKASRARIVEASDTARRRLERDLHDGAQQRLVALGLSLQRARRLAASSGHDELAELLESITGDVRGAIDDIRSVSRGTHPPLLAERGLANAIDALAERAPVPVRIDIAAGALPSEAETTAYYVVAEGLTNIAKHAQATEASVSISQRNGSALIEVSDDGNGGATMSAGSGLQGLDDRAAAAGGAFAIRTGPSGTTLEATIPCE